MTHAILAQLLAADYISKAWEHAMTRVRPGQDLFASLKPPEAAGAVLWLQGGCIDQALAVANLAYARTGNTRLGYWREIIKLLKEAKGNE